MTTKMSTKNLSVQFAIESNLCIYHSGAILDFDSNNNNTNNNYNNDIVMTTQHNNNTNYNRICPQDIWYQHLDLQIIKKKAMELAREANRYGLGSLLANAYNCTSTSSSSSSSANTTITNTSTNTDATIGSNGIQYIINSNNNTNSENDNLLHSLIIWCVNATNRRGLERFINNEYSYRRSELRKRTIKSVLRAQTKMKQEYTTSCSTENETTTTGSSIANDEYRIKVLCRLSETFSQPARTFAQLLGIADAYAVQHENNNNTTGSGTNGSITTMMSTTTTAIPTTIHQQQQPKATDTITVETDKEVSITKTAAAATNQVQKQKLNMLFDKQQLRSMSIDNTTITAPMTSDSSVDSSCSISSSNCQRNNGSPLHYHHHNDEIIMKEKSVVDNNNNYGNIPNSVNSSINNPSFDIPIELHLQHLKLQEKQQQQQQQKKHSIHESPVLQQQQEQKIITTNSNNAAAIIGGRRKNHHGLHAAPTGRDIIDTTNTSRTTTTFGTSIDLRHYC